MASGDIYEVQLLHTYRGQTVLNTFGMLNNGGGDPDARSAIATALQSGLGSAWMGGRSNQIELVGVRVLDVKPGTAAPVELPISPTVPGDVDEDGAPGNCALVISLKTLLKGRSFRGRMYLAGYPTTTMEGGYWTSDAQDPASGAYSELDAIVGVAAAGATGADLAIISRYADKVLRAPPIATLVSDFTIRNVILSMRTRTVGHGA